MYNLEILLITYNRASLLSRTLMQFSESPFLSCKWTILDNCSTDNTPEVCSHFKEIYPNITIIRHKKNLGASANLMRAVELAEAEYTWLVMDDDVYDFTHLADLEEALASGEADLIITGGWRDLNNLYGKYINTRDMLEKHNMFFSVVLFASSTIYKTKEFSDDVIRAAYKFSDNMFNHFPFYNKMLQLNKRVYITQRGIIKSGNNELHGFTNFDLALAHMHVCQHVTDSRMRNRSVQELVFSKGFLSIAGHIILAKAKYDNAMIFFKQKFIKLITVFLGLGLYHKLAFLMGMLAFLLPNGVCRYIASRYEPKPIIDNSERQELMNKQIERSKQL